MQEKLEVFSKEHKSIEFEPNLPKIKDVENCLIVFDDYMTKMSGEDNRFFTDFVTREVHHINASVILILHNMFSKNMRTISLSTTYIVFFKQVRDKTTVKILGKQMFHCFPGYLDSVYEHCVKKAYGFLFIDMHVLSNDKFRLRNKVDITSDSLLFSSV